MTQESVQYWQYDNHMSDECHFYFNSEFQSNR